MNLMPAPGKMSRASMKADPTIPNTFFVPLETSVSVKASLEVINVGLVVHSFSSLPTTVVEENRILVFRLQTFHESQVIIITFSVQIPATFLKGE